MAEVGAKGKEGPERSKVSKSVCRLQGVNYNWILTHHLKLVAFVKLLKNLKTDYISDAVQ